MITKQQALNLLSEADENQYSELCAEIDEKLTCYFEGGWNVSRKVEEYGDEHSERLIFA